MWEEILSRTIQEYPNGTKMYLNSIVLMDILVMRLQWNSLPTRSLARTVSLLETPLLLEY